MAKLRFTCPKCNCNTLECCLDGPHRCDITSIDDEGELEWGLYESNGDINRFQCSGCGYILENVTDDEEVVEWVKENCPQEENSQLE